MKHPEFESGVLKIKMGQTRDLSKAEKQSVEILLRKHVSNEDEGQSSSEEAGRVGIAKSLKKGHKSDDGRDNYMNCEFILGSVAEMDRLWRTYKNVLTVTHRPVTPKLFAVLMCLIINHRFWDAQLVGDAITARLHRATARIAAHKCATLRL